jgi:hypothetical protein
MMTAGYGLLQLVQYYGGDLREMTGHGGFRIRIIWAKMEFTDKQTLSNARNMHFNRQEV